MYENLSPRLLVATLLGVCLTSGACRDVASYAAGQDLTAPAPDASARPDRGEPTPDMDEPERDAGAPPDLSPPDSWPSLDPGDCRGPFWVPPALRLGEAGEGAVVALPSGGWLVARTHGDTIHLHRLDDRGQTSSTTPSPILAAAPRDLTLALHQGAPVLAWSENIATGSCRRRLAFRFVDSGVHCVHEEPGRSLVEPSLLSVGQDVHAAAALVWDCNNTTRHSKLYPLRVTLDVQQGTCTAADDNYVGYSESYKPLLRGGSASSSHRWLLHQRRASGSVPSDPPTLQIFDAAISQSGAGVITVSPPLDLDQQPGDGRYDALLVQDTLWIAWELGASQTTPTPRIRVRQAQAAGLASSPLATVSAAAEPALFALPTHGVHGLVFIHTATKTLTAGHLPPSPSAPVSTHRATLRDESSGQTRHMRSPRAASNASSVGVIWIEDETQRGDTQPVLYFRPFFCQGS